MENENLQNQEIEREEVTQEEATELVNSGEAEIPNTKDSIATFHDMLSVGYIKVGTKIAFTPKDGEETEVVVDEAFLKLPIKDKEFYEEFNYKVVE